MVLEIASKGCFTLKRGVEGKNMAMYLPMYMKQQDLVMVLEEFSVVGNAKSGN
jgi:hypothetical protein